MTKTNAMKKLTQLGPVEMDDYDVDFRVTLDNFDLICNCNPGETGAVLGFIVESHKSGHQTYKPNFRQAIEWLDRKGW